ncbi:hypothetical protein MRX96_010072 [Rhipicephalus microplus]
MSPTAVSLVSMSLRCLGVWASKQGLLGSGQRFNLNPVVHPSRLLIAAVDVLRHAERSLRRRERMRIVLRSDEAASSAPAFPWVNTAVCAMPVPRCVLCGSWQASHLHAVYI